MRGKTTSQGVSETLKPILEERPTVLYSLEELKHQFTDGILNLPKRTAFAIISGEGMVKIETLNVPDLVVSPAKRKRILGEIKQHSPIHKPTHEANREIEERFIRFMDGVSQDVIDHDPMNPPAFEIPKPAPLTQKPADDDPMNPNG